MSNGLWAKASEPNAKVLSKVVANSTRFIVSPRAVGADGRRVNKVARMSADGATNHFEGITALTRDYALLDFGTPLLGLGVAQVRPIDEFCLLAV